MQAGVLRFLLSGPKRPPPFASIHADKKFGSKRSHSQRTSLTGPFLRIAKSRALVDKSCMLLPSRTQEQDIDDDDDDGGGGGGGGGGYQFAVHFDRKEK